MDSTLDASAFLSGSFDYTSFDGPLSSGSGLTPLPTSASPPPQQLSMLPNSSVDSGIALDDGEMPLTRRGSSEEKDSMTPAQSRRKAQNRAAYVLSSDLVLYEHKCLTSMQTESVSRTERKACPGSRGQTQSTHNHDVIPTIR